MKPVKKSDAYLPCAVPFSTSKAFVAIGLVNQVGSVEPEKVNHTIGSVPPGLALLDSAPPGSASPGSVPSLVSSLGSLPLEKTSKQAPAPLSTALVFEIPSLATLIESQHQLSASVSPIKTYSNASVEEKIESVITNLDSAYGSYQRLIEATEKYVKEEMAGQDGSHDWWHIHRVRNLAVSLAKEEGLTVNLDVIELAALLHDIKDWKYSGSETAGSKAARAFLEQLAYAKDKISMVCAIIEGIGFKTELGKSVDIFPELAVVQDADRLDAIGAVGIARTFTYGGSKNQALYEPGIQRDIVYELTKTDYMNKKSSTVQHFYDKLLKLKDMMKTKSGAKKAAARHLYMEEYLKQFFDEWDGC